jgi:hypothetical protein
MTGAPNQNSLFNKYSRYVGGGTSEVLGTRLDWWERSIFDRDNSDATYVVENAYEGRLDLIAAIFYNEPRYWWVLAQYNNILDPFYEIKPGRILMIPSKERLPLMLLSRQGGVDSQKQPVETISPIIA